MDGAYYFKQVSDAIDACVSAGDAIYVTSWFLDPTLRLTPAADPLGDRLVAKAAAGVDVRVILFSLRAVEGDSSQEWLGMTAAQMGVFALGFWEKSRAAVGAANNNSVVAHALRTQVPAGGGAPPLSDRVLLDWSGTWGLHVKGVVVRAAGSTMGFVGGIDFGWNRLDKQIIPSGHR